MVKINPFPSGPTGTQTSIINESGFQIVPSYFPQAPAHRPPPPPPPAHYNSNFYQQQTLHQNYPTYVDPYHYQQNIHQQQNCVRPRQDGNNNGQFLAYMAFLASSNSNNN